MLEAGSTVGRYLVKRKIAEGGMAEIFLASAVGPEGFSKDVVLKVVRSFLASDQQFVQMFIAEARLASRLNHANVVQIFDFGKHDNSYYLAMEYVHGASLWDLRRKCRELSVPFPPTLAAEICAQVARGLQYAHSLSEGGQKIGVVHRDVTPHNVLLSFDGAVKLTDFGIAKATSSHTAPGMLKGKFAYMSPEQARGEKVDARTDLFALGIVLWELVTGGRLFEGDSDLAVLRSVQESLIPPAARVNPDVPMELSELISKALARPLDERFQSGFELERALANFVLRAAKSAEDTSVAAFLQQLYKDEIAREDQPLEPTDASPRETLSGDDDFGVGDTAARPKTITATPVGPNPARTHTTPSRRPSRGAMDDEEGPAKRTEEFDRLGDETLPPDGKVKPQTEQMPALKRPTMRRFDPLPVQEPSVVVRPSAALPPPPEAPPEPEPEPLREPSMPSVTETAGVDDVPLTVPGRSNTPLMVVLGILVVGLLGGGAVLAFGPRTNETPPVAVTEPFVPPTVAPGKTAAEAVKPDAGAVADGEQQKERDAGLDTNAGSDALAASVDAGLDTKIGPDAVAGSADAGPPPPVRVAKKAMGSLLVKAIPFANVTIQGKSYEVMGTLKIPAPVGTYEIVLKHPRKTAKEKVTVPATGSATVTFSAE